MASSHSSRNVPPPTRWWISSDGAAQGPYNHAYVLACLKTGQLDGTTLVCPESGQQWKSIADWPVFASAVHNDAATAATPTNVSEVRGTPATDANGGLVTNRQLPPMANWICVYCIVVSPGIWVLDIASTVASGFQDQVTLFLNVVSSALFTLVAGMLFAGGCQLRDLRQSGPRLIMAALWISIAMFFLTVLLAIGILAFDPSSFDNPGQSVAMDAISCLLFPMYVADLVFQVVALIWLIANTRRLPLG